MEINFASADPIAVRRKPGCRGRHILRILAMSIGENHSPDTLREYMGE